MFYSNFLLFLLQDKIISNEQIALLAYTIVVMLLLVTIFVLFFTTFQKRKNKLLLEKLEQQRRFETELVKVQTEIQEETLKNIGRELHDNVGQLLSFASMQLNLVATMAKDKVKTKVDDTLEVVKDAIEEVRALSKSLNNDVISNLGLITSIQNEIDRLNKLNKIEGNLEVKGVEQTINPNDEIILFRTFQEFLSNTIKYSEASVVSVLMNYSNNHLELIVEDNGKGFDQETIKKGSGLINMENRASLINADYSLISKPKEGVKLVLIYPLKSATQNT
jgi:signal transduction histidine kinase